MRWLNARRKLLALAVAAAAVLRGGTLDAQSALTGQVSDETNSPVAGALVSVTCDDSAKVTTTGSDGRFWVRVSPSDNRCTVAVSRLGFQFVSVTVPVTPALLVPRIVIRRNAGTSEAVTGAGHKGVLAIDRAAFERRWEITTTYTGGRTAAGGLDEQMQRLAGGDRWQIDSAATYLTRSGFAFTGGAIVRRGYGMPLFMSRPFADRSTLPDFFPPAAPTVTDWDAVFTLTTPTTHLRGISIAGYLQAYTQLNQAPKGAAASHDRGVRTGLHFSFK